MFSAKQYWQRISINSPKNWGLLAIIVVHVIIAYTFISYQNITYDEPSYIEYSKRWLHGKPERIEPLDDSKTPVISIVWIPRIVRQIINPSYQLNDYGRKDQKEGRYMMIVFSILTIIYLYRFTTYFKMKYWWAVFLFLIIDPLFIAYSVLINSDLLSGFILLATVFHLIKYLFQKEEKQFYIASLFLAIGLVTKHSFLFFVPLFWLFILHTNKKIDWKKLLSFILIIMLVINSVFYFHHSFKSLGSYHFESTSFKNLQSSLSFLNWLPIPLPENYLQSIDLSQYHSQLGGNKNNTYTGVYLLGQTKLHGGFWYYYIIQILYKFPLSLLSILIIGFSVCVIKWKKIENQKKILLATFLWIFGALSFLNSFQIGIRHLLLIIPLLYVLMAFVLNKLLLQKQKILVGVLCAIMLVSVAKYFPYLIPYTNEIVLNKERVYEKIMDSGIDYGQNDSLIIAKLRTDSTLKVPTNIAAKGKYLLSMKTYVEQLKNGDSSLNWLVKHYEPQKQLAFVALIYDVK